MMCLNCIVGLHNLCLATTSKPVDCACPHQTSHKQGLDWFNSNHYDGVLPSMTEEDVAKSLLHVAWSRGMRGRFPKHALLEDVLGAAVPDNNVFDDVKQVTDEVLIAEYNKLPVMKRVAAAVGLSYASCRRRLLQLMKDGVIKDQLEAFKTMPLDINIPSKVLRVKPEKPEDIKVPKFTKCKCCQVDVPWGLMNKEHGLGKCIKACEECSTGRASIRSTFDGKPYWLCVRCDKELSMFRQPYLSPKVSYLDTVSRH